MSAVTNLLMLVALVVFANYITDVICDLIEYRAARRRLTKEPTNDR